MIAQQCSGIMDTSQQSHSRADDIALARLLAEGNTAAVETFCAAYTPHVRLYIMARLSDFSTDEHDDLTQVIVIAALKGIRNYRGNSSLLTWILSITHNKVADALRSHIRRRQREIPFSEVAPDGDASDWSLPDTNPQHEPEAAAILSAMRGRVRATITQLKPELQEVLILRYVEELAVADIAVVLGLNKRKVEFRLTEARAEFRKRLTADRESIGLVTQS